METLSALAASVAARLKERRETIAVSESSTGGLISAALLAVPGASAYFLGGAVVYTQVARRVLVDLPDISSLGMRALTEPYIRMEASLSGNLEAPQRDQEKLIEAFAAGDCEGLEKLTFEQLQTSGKRLIAYLESNPT